MIKAALILASDDKGLQPVFGIPAVRRLFLLIHQAGLEAIHIIGHVNSLTPIFSDCIASPSFHHVENPALLDRVVEGIGLSREEEVLVLKANYVIDRCSFARLIEASDSSGRYFMEAMGDNPAEGLYVARFADLVFLLRSLWSSDGLNLKVLDKWEKVSGIAGLPYVIGKEKERMKISEAKLIAALSCQTATDDGFLARHFDRKVSRSISKKLVNSKVTPNQITLAGMTIGLIGAFLLSRPGYWPQLIGSLLFLFCVVADGVDGEVARLRLEETPFGHYLDVVTDNIVHIAIFVGIAFGLYHETGEVGYLRVLWFLVGGFGLCALAVYQCILKRNPNELKQSSKSLQLMSLLTNRDFAYLVVALAAVHRLNWFLLGAAVGTYLFAGALWVMRICEKRATPH